MTGVQETIAVFPFRYNIFITPSKVYIRQVQEGTQGRNYPFIEPKMFLQTFVHYTDIPNKENLKYSNVKVQHLYKVAFFS